MVQLDCLQSRRNLNEQKTNNVDKFDYELNLPPTRYMHEAIGQY